MHGHGSAGALWTAWRRQSASDDVLAVVFTILTVALAAAPLTKACAAVEYDFVGGNFTSVSGPYTTADQVTGDVVFTNPLPPSSVITALPTGLTAFSLVNFSTTTLTGSVAFSFTDGVNTITNGNASSFGITLDTNGADQITGSNLEVDTIFSPTHTAKIGQTWEPGDPIANESYGATAGPVGTAGSGYHFTAGTWSAPITSLSSACVTDIRGAAFNPIASGADMTATFTISGGLMQAEQDCGITSFNWEQTINILQTPNPFYPSQNPTVNASAPPSFIDPVPGGWDTTLHKITCGNGKTFTTKVANGENSNPFYWGPTELAGNETATTLSFLDTPTNVCLSGLPWAGPTTSGAYEEFTTTLVGMNGISLISLPAIDTWDWVTTFNGTAGGAQTLENIIPADPGSGTGGTAIISVNGVPVSVVAEPPEIMVFVLALFMLGPFVLVKTIIKSSSS
jgi:hypothetical protein